MNKQIEILQNRLIGMKSLIPAGVMNDDQFNKYFSEQNTVVEDIVKTLSEIDNATTTEMENIKDTIKLFRENMKVASANMTQLSKRDVQYEMGKALVGAWTNNKQLLGECKCIPNLRAEKWNNPKDFSWTAEKGFTAQKEVYGDPMGNMATNDQYLINPIYEEAIMTDVSEKSVMMNLVTTRPMLGPSIFIPERDKGGVELKWLTSIGQKIEGSKPNGPTKKELKAYTLAGYIPWYDEFDEDVYVDLGKMFIDEFTDSYATEFDKQCLTANSDPFTGALYTSKAETFQIGSSDFSKLNYLNFRDAELKVRAEERKDCCWFFNETVLNHIANIQDNNGNPIWRKPGDKMPGVVDGYKYYESSLLPQISDLTANKPFAIFMNPKRIIHGNRKGIEIKRFEGTSESLEFGELFMRFRKRSGFLVTRPTKNMVIMSTSA